MTEALGFSGLGVLCVNFDSAQLISQNLRQVHASGAKVYVADNFHSTSARDEILELCAAQGFQLLEMSENLGFGEAVNRLAERALGDGCTHLLLQNPDARVECPELAVMLNFSAVHPEAIVSPTILNDNGSVWFEGGELDLQNGVARHASWRYNPDWMTAACLLVPVGVWRQLGGFAKGYFLYWEDVDLTFRWRVQGGEMVVLLLQASHSVGGTQQIGSKSALYARYNARNRLLFAWRNLGLRDLLRWAGNARTYHAELLARFGEGTPSAFNRYQRSAKFGMVEGLFLGGLAWLRRRFKVSSDRERLSQFGEEPPRTLSLETIHAVNTHPKLYAFPYYADNPWQRMTYSSLDTIGFQVVPNFGLPILPHHSRLLPGDVLHINWTGPVSQAADSLEQAMSQVTEAVAAITDAKSHGVGVLWTVHNVMPHECPFPEAELAFLQQLTHLADSIMVMNPNTANLVEKAGYSLPLEKVSKIPHSSYLGVLPEGTDRVEARKRLSIPDKARVLLCLGELRPYKRIDHVIRAFRGIEDPDFALIIAGRPSAGISHEQIQEWCGDDARIRLSLERQTDDMVALYLSAADLLVNSHESGLNSGVVALASTYGCPVAVGTQPETAALRQESWAIPSDLRDDSTSVAELRAATELVFRNRERFRAAAFQWAEQNSPATISREFAQLVDSLKYGTR